MNQIFLSLLILGLFAFIIPNAYAENVPDWVLNRQKDYDTGEYIHTVSVDLKMLHDDDLNRMKKVKSYKGIRHASGHKVRGQRTYSNGRKGLALGVSRKKGTGP